MSKQNITAIIQLGRARTFFIITPIVFVRTKNVKYTRRMDWRLVKLNNGLIFIYV